MPLWATVLEFSRETEAMGCVRVCQVIYYKELAHVIIEAKKSQDLQLTNWRARRADGVVQSKSQEARDPGN